MSGLAEVFARLSNDPAFGDLLRHDPVQALRDYELEVEDLQRLEAALGSRPSTITILLGAGDPERDPERDKVRPGTADTADTADTAVTAVIPGRPAGS